ncbi:hypothetical protein OQA88_5324 [Cercophora sp. LCS_1]
MSDCPESGMPQFSPMFALGLQALAVTCLVSWLVFFHARRGVPEGGTQPHEEQPNTELLATGRDGETAKELFWIGNEADTADKPVPFDKDPFSILHFRVGLPPGHGNEPSSESCSQPVELVFHSSWLPISDTISLHISNGGVSAFSGSYLRQHPLRGRDRPGRFAVRDAGTIPVYSPHTTRETWYTSLIIIAAGISFMSLALGVTDRLALRASDNATQFPWPQAAETQPLELWDQAWEALGHWAEVMEPLMPEEEPRNSNNIHAAFHSLPSPHQTISELCGQLSFISSSTSGANARASAGSAATRERISKACDTADYNLDQFDSDWADLLSYFSRGWLRRPIQELYSAGYNTSRFQYLEEEATSTDARDDTEDSRYGFSKLEGAGVAGPGTGTFNHTFNNQTAQRLLAIANPSFPRLRPSAANMTRRLRSLQARASTAAESIAAVTELLPLELRAHRAGYRPDDTPDASFAKQWVGFDFSSWWSGDDTASGYGSAATQRAAKEVARLHAVVKAFRADVAESLRRATAIEDMLDTLERKVTALTQAKKPKRGRTAAGVSDLDGAWVALAWRADCACDGSGAQTSHVITATATPVVVAYFVPSAETLFQGMKETYGLLTDTQASARRRREGALAETDRTAHERWREYSLEHGGAAAVGGEEGCLDVSVDGDGSRKCLRLDEIGARVRSRLQAEFGVGILVGIDFGRAAGAEQEPPLLDG